MGKHIWYTKEDYCTISDNNRKVARKFFKGGLVEGTDERHTFRGLEEFDEIVSRERKKVLFRSVKAVLFEQSRQKSSGVDDPVSIANAYRSQGATAAHQAIAAEIGIIDHECSIRCMSNVKKESTKTLNKSRTSVSKGTRKSLKALVRSQLFSGI